MVNTGRSRGCHTCKKRRVKCDEGRPGCATCLRLGHECAGYEKRPPRIRFAIPKIGPASESSGSSAPERRPVDDRTKAGPIILSVAEQKRQHKRSSPTQPKLALAPPSRDVALGFLVQYFANYGRHTTTARGFWESVPLMLRAEGCGSNSPATVAVTAVAMSMLYLWKGNASAFTAPSPALGRALAILQDALVKQHKRPLPYSGQSTSSSAVAATRYSAVLASLALQFYDDMLGLYGRSRPPRMIHHNGAVGLLRDSVSRSEAETTAIIMSAKARPADQKAYREMDADRALSALLLRNLSHGEIIYGLRTGSDISSGLTELLEQHDIKYGCSSSRNRGGRGCGGCGLTPGPADSLDRIGVEVVRVNHAFCSGTDVHRLARDYDVSSLHSQLRAWPESVPDFWLPLAVVASGAGGDLDRLYTYDALDVYHVYPSIQTASIWNIWRLEQLALLRLQLLTTPSEYPYDNDDRRGPGEQAAQQDHHDYHSHSHSHSHDLDLNRIRTQQEVQSLVDAVCQSVPFHLGNRLSRGSLADFADGGIVQPSYRDYAALAPLPPPPLAASSRLPCLDGAHGSAYTRDYGQVGGWPVEEYSKFTQAAPDEDKEETEKEEREAGHENTYDPFATSPVEHMGHAISQGPWHIRRTLGLLLGLLFRHRGGAELLGCLRQGQVTWLRGQYARAGVLLGVEEG